MNAEDRALIADVLAQVACWDDPDLVAAVHHRVSDGSDTTDRRWRIAVSRGGYRWSTPQPNDA
ncbi:hypothetical protein [Williamsia sterculiae]|uniref:hypothetical protein n=1 Tax=Williamsia sterculiae TaxID=1344003 RepID=UPI0009707059|nr:hypothetical protein [Williamsia sterculiae]